MTAQITIISGAGPYSDPWHPFADTSKALARILETFGQITVRDDVDEALAALCNPDSQPDLLVLNVGNAGPGTPRADARDGLVSAAAAGVPILALHAAATTFPDWDQWPLLLGGHWVRGTSFHPVQSACTIFLSATGQQIAGISEPFETVDERYTQLDIGTSSVPLAWHHHDGTAHALAWCLSKSGRRAAYVGLGHDVAAYESEGTRALIRGAAQWLLELGDR